MQKFCHIYLIIFMTSCASYRSKHQAICNCHLLSGRIEKSIFRAELQIPLNVKAWTCDGKCG